MTFRILHVHSLVSMHKVEPDTRDALIVNDICRMIRIREWSRMFDASNNQFATEL